MVRMMLKSVMAAVVAAVSAASANANFVDNFTAPAPAVTQTVTTGSPFANSISVAPGLTRNTAATLTANGVTPSGITLGDVGGTGVLSFGLGSGAKGSASLTYTYTAATDLSGAGTDFILTFAEADLNVPFSVKLTDSSSASNTQASTANAGGGVYTFSMSSFGGVNLSSISSIEILVNAGPGSVTSADFTLTSAQINTPTPPAVPAPPAVILALAAIPALGVARIARRKAVQA